MTTPPGVLAGVAGQAFQLHGHVDEGGDLLVLVVGALEVLALGQGLLQGHAQLEGDQLGDAVHEAVGVTQDPAHIAHHGLRGHGAEGDDLGDRVAPIAPGDIVDDQVTLLHAEVDIEVGHGDPLGVEEALEQQLVFDGVEIGDLEGIGDQGPGTGAAPWPHRDGIVLGPLDEVGDDQEVAGEAHLDDDVQLDGQPLVIDFAPLAEVRGLRVEDAHQALLQPLARLGDEECVRGHALGDGEVRQAGLPQGQLQVAAPGDLDAVLQRLGDVREQLHHLLGAAQVLLLAVAVRATRIVQGAALADADSGLVGLIVLRAQEAHVVGGHHRDAEARRQVHAGLAAFVFQLAPGAGQLQVVTVAKQLHPVMGEALGLGPVASEQGMGDIALHPAGQGDEPVGGRDHPGPLHLGQPQVLALLVGSGDQSGQIEVAGPILHQEGQAVGLVGVGVVAQPQVHPGDGLDPCPQGCLVETHQGEEIDLIGHGHGGHPGTGNRLDQGLDTQEPVDQGVFGVDTQMYEAGFQRSESWMRKVGSEANPGQPNTRVGSARATPSLPGFNRRQAAAVAGVRKVVAGDSARAQERSGYPPRSATAPGPTGHAPGLDCPWRTYIGHRRCRSDAGHCNRRPPPVQRQRVYQSPGRWQPQPRRPDFRWQRHQWPPPRWSQRPRWSRPFVSQPPPRSRRRPVRRHKHDNCCHPPGTGRSRDPSLAKPGRPDPPMVWCSQPGSGAAVSTGERPSDGSTWVRLHSAQSLGLGATFSQPPGHFLTYG